MASYFLVGEESFSANENRYLAKKPSFNLDSLLEGRFTQELEKYVDDQFVFRNRAMEAKTQILKALGRQDINGVYLAQDNYLIEKIGEEDLDQEQFNKNIQALRSFSDQWAGQELRSLIVPTAGLVLKDKLPSLAPQIQEDRLLDQLAEDLGPGFIDLRPRLEAQKEDYLYYRTDHHWTSLAAYLAYEELAQLEGRQVSLEDYRIERVSRDFRGSLYSKILDRSMPADEIDLFHPKSPVDYRVYYDFGSQESDSVYSRESLEEKDQYKVFLGGNYPELKIQGENKNNRRLLIFKDSYANALLPFLVGDYESISLVDLRYFKADLAAYIEENQINEFLLVYNIKNFSSDENIEKLNIGQKK